MPTTTDLKTEIKTLATKAQDAVLDKDLTPAEIKTALDGIETDIQSKTIALRALEVEESDTKSIEAQRAALGDSNEPFVQAGGKSMGAQFFDSPQVKGLIEAGAFSTNDRKQFATGSVEIKAVISEAASPIIQPQVQPGIVDIRFQMPTVESLIPSGQTASNVVKYFQETTATNAAAAVAELGTKPESSLILDDVDEPVRKIATILRVSDEMLEDLPQARSYIDARGSLFITLETDDQLLNGSGTPPAIDGILNRSLATAVPKGVDDTGPEAIYKQITALRVGSFMEADGIVIHPNDWQDIRLGKDDNGQYYAGGPFMGQYGAGGMANDTLWGKKVVVTQAIAEGTALVGAFSTCAQVFNRKGVTVEAVNTDQDDFSKNRVTIRFERRLALAVYRPTAFGTVTGL